MIGAARRKEWNDYKRSAQERKGRIYIMEKKNLVRRVWENKVGRIAMIGGLALTLFGGGAGASAAIAVTMFNQTGSDNLQKKLTDLNTWATDIIDRFNVLKTEKTNLQAANTDLQTTIDAQTAQITDLQTQVVDLEAQLAAAGNSEAEIAALQTEIDSLNAQIAQLESEKTDATNAFTSSQGEVLKANTELNESYNLADQITIKANAWKQANPAPTTTP